MSELGEESLETYRPVIPTALPGVDLRAAERYCAATCDRYYGGHRSHPENSNHRRLSLAGEQHVAGGTRLGRRTEPARTVVSGRSSRSLEDHRVA